MTTESIEGRLDIWRFIQENNAVTLVVNHYRRMIQKSREGIGLPGRIWFN